LRRAYKAFGADTPFIFEGPITRTVQDAAIALDALSGYHPGDPYSLDEATNFSAATRRSLRDWKIAYSPNLDAFPVDPRVADVVGKAVRISVEAVVSFGPCGGDRGPIKTDSIARQISSFRIGVGEIDNEPNVVTGTQTGANAGTTGRSTARIPVESHSSVGV
jgi:hypothetical protein